MERTKERCSVADQQVEELKQELLDVESILHTNQDEMTSLNEQLTTVSSMKDLTSRVFMRGVRAFMEDTK